MAAFDLSDKLVVAISSRALFNLEDENHIFEYDGLEAYAQYQINHENEILQPGTAFPIVKALLALNGRFSEPIVEILIISRNSPETGMRVFNSIQYYNLGIVRAAFTGGEKINPYLEAFNVDLFLSKNKDDVQEAIDSNVAAALIYDSPHGFSPSESQIRIAFDADAVIFSDESEKIYQEQGLAAFLQHEEENARLPLPEGPFGKLLKILCRIKQQEQQDERLLRIAIVTARNSPAHKRVIYTLRQWGVDIDEAFFLGGVSKDRILKAFNAHIFFDDQDVHLKNASEVVPSARVPYRRE